MGAVSGRGGGRKGAPSRRLSESKLARRAYDHQSSWKSRLRSSLIARLCSINPVTWRSASVLQTVCFIGLKLPSTAAIFSVREITVSFASNDAASQVQRAPKRRMPQRDAVHVAGPRPLCARRLAARLQSRQAAPKIGREDPRRDHRPTCLEHAPDSWHHLNQPP